MHAIFEVFGLIQDADEVRSTVDDLVQHGVPRDEVQVIEAAPGRYRLADEHLSADLAGAARGAVFGALIGMAVGLLAVWAVPGLETASGAQWSLGAFFAGVMGGFVGAMAGLQGNDELGDDEMVEYQVPAGAPWQILAVRSDRWHARAHRIMGRHRVTFLDEPAPHA